MCGLAQILDRNDADQQYESEHEAVLDGSGARFVVDEL